MAKIITLEKGNDGVYTATGKIEEEKVEDKSKKENERVYKVPESNRRNTKQTRRKKNPIYDDEFETEDIQRFIANNGDKASEFLKGIQTTVKALNLLRKIKL